MKIGIDARFYGEAGPGRYVAQLLINLEKIDSENDYVIYLKRSNFDSYSPQNPKFKKSLEKSEQSKTRVSSWCIFGGSFPWKAK